MGLASVLFIVVSVVINVPLGGRTSPSDEVCSPFALVASIAAFLRATSSRAFFWSLRPEVPIFSKYGTLNTFLSTCAPLENLPQLLSLFFFSQWNGDSYPRCCYEGPHSRAPFFLLLTHGPLFLWVTRIFLLWSLLLLAPSPLFSVSLRDNDPSRPPHHYQHPSHPWDLYSCWG